MKNLYLAFIRHGAYEQPEGVPSAHLPHPLTNEGKQHAKSGASQLKELLKENQIQFYSTNLYSSNLLRAYQSALSFSQEFSTQITQSEKLCERCVGSMANLTVSQIEAILKKDPRFDDPPEGWKSSPHYQLPVPNAESLFQAGQRVKNFVCERLELAEENSLNMFVGHGASIRYCAHHFGIWSIEEVGKHSMFYGTPVLYKVQFKDSDHHQFQHIAGQWKVRKPKDIAKD